MSMKRINFTLFTILLLAIVFSCTKANLNYTQNGNWVHRAPFGSGTATAIGVGYPASFVLGSVAYVGTGVNPASPSNKLTQFWAYTPGVITDTNYLGAAAAGTWAQVAAFIGAPRSNGIGFNTGGLGYVGTGLANDGTTVYADFYQYNPNSNSWAVVDSLFNDSASFPRYDAASFSFDTAAYVMTGTDGFHYFNDVWRFSATTGQWTQLPNMPGNQRSGALTWIYGNEGYILTGYTPSSKWASGNLAYDFWRFDPAALDPNVQWSRLRDIYNTSAGTFDDGYTNIIRKNGASFVILKTAFGDKGYVTLGANNSTAINFTWEYDFASDIWTEKSPFNGNARTGATGFTLNNRGFVTCGLNVGAQQAYTDCEEFFPNQVYNPLD
jgi:N-acetylneuraminic acid mutarotase